MKIETANLIAETMQFLESKPFHYDEEELFQLTESIEHGTLLKRGNNFSLTTRGKVIELKPQPAKRMWDRYSKKVESGVSDEMAKKIAKRRRSITEARQLYKINKAKEQMIVACGDLVIGSQELYVMIFETPNRGYVLMVLHMDFSNERTKSQIFYSQLEELSNYATKRPFTMDKRLDKRGSGSKENVGRKAKDDEE